MWRLLLSAPGDGWVDGAAIARLADLTSSGQSSFLNRWRTRGWLERRTLSVLGNPHQWRLTREGRIGAHAVIARANARAETVR